MQYIHFWAIRESHPDQNYFHDQNLPQFSKAIDSLYKMKNTKIFIKIFCSCNRSSHTSFVQRISPHKSVRLCRIVWQFTSMGNYTRWYADIYKETSIIPQSEATFIERFLYLACRIVHWYQYLPVTGASISIIVFSCRKSAAPSFIILRATSSVTLPSNMKCCLKTSGRGLPLESNTSLMVSLWLGGNGTPKTDKIYEHVYRVTHSNMWFFEQWLMKAVKNNTVENTIENIILIAFNIHHYVTSLPLPWL